MPEKFNSFDLGPAISDWMKLKEASSELILTQIKDQPIPKEKLIDVVDDLIGMNLPLEALVAIDYNIQNWAQEDFRSSFMEGIASMLVGEYSRSELAFFRAHQAEPSEPGPYVNLAQIYANDHELEKALEWVKEGLNVDYNNFNLWQMFYEVSNKKTSFKTQEIRYEADKRHSWVGLSLFLHLEPNFNGWDRLSILEPFYAEGERSHDFLIEYTGVLGECSLYEQIPPIVITATKLLQSQEEVPWKLSVHLAQAYLALEKDELFNRELLKLQKRKDIPTEVLNNLKEPIHEIDPSLHTKSTGTHRPVLTSDYSG